MKRVFRLTLALPEDIAVYLQGLVGERQVSETLRKALEVFLTNPQRPKTPLPFREDTSAMTTIVVDQDQYEQVKRIAVEWNTSRVAVLRYALRQYMRKVQEGETS